MRDSLHNSKSARCFLLHSSRAYLLERILPDERQDSTFTNLELFYHDNHTGTLGQEWFGIIG